MSDIKPCPFCGSMELIYEEHTNDCYLRMVLEVYVGTATHTHGALITAWDKRYDQLLN